MGQTPLNPLSTAKFSAVRLLPHQDLKNELMEVAKKSELKAGFIITCVGSLEQVHLRFANQESGTILKGHFEILSLVGTIGEDSAHLHLTVADSTGKTWGGHLLENTIVYTTAEVVYGELTDLKFDRILDTTYGYKELQVIPLKKSKK